VREIYPQYQSADQVLTESAAGAFMSRVYAWMVAGLALTGITAFAVAVTPAAMQVVSGLFWPLAIAQLVLVFALSAMAPRVSGPAAALMFLGYSFLTGLTFSGLFWIYKLGSVASAFFVTAGAFGALSVYATVTKRDLRAWSKFLFIGLIGVVLASLVSIFVHSGMLVFVINCAAVLVFGGLTAFHTQMLRQFYANSGYRSAQALAVNGALMLYLDFINIFLSILQLTGRRRD
jgi:FtsH-binding integral membrane protein